MWLPHRSAELDQINLDPKVNWYRMARKKIDQKIVHESECYSMKKPRGDKKCEVWKRSETGVLLCHLLYSTCAAYTLPSTLSKDLEASKY